MAKKPLNPTGGPVSHGRMVLRTPGLRGEVDVYRPADEGLRGAEQTTAELDAALAAANVRPDATVVLSDTKEVGTGSGRSRSTAYKEPAIVLEVPAPGEGWGQMVLATDESGVATWNFPVDTNNQVNQTRGGGSGINTYVIRRPVPPVPTDPADVGNRGIIGAVGKKLLKVLVFPLVDPIMGEIGDRSVRTWEEKKRPYRVRLFGADSYTQADAAPLTGEDWARLGRGRALLFLHGTFSRAHSGFGGFRADDMRALWDQYEGRVFAFDHFTLSDDPRQNVDHLLADLLPDGITLDLDIVSHSRGGLVARVLAEKQGELSLGSRTLGVRKVIFTATPNGGTHLADPDRIGAYLETVTNLLQFLPDNGVTEVLETVVTVAKHAAVATANDLEGLVSMRPDGSFLKSLNAGPAGGAAYFALASNFEPKNDGWKRFIKDRVLDAFFEKENDLVVPTAGVYEANENGYFPIADPVLFIATDRISHSDFFRNPKAADQILAWLQG